MVHAYLMVSTAAGQSEAVLSAVSDAEAVSDAHVVAGNWDLVVELDAETVTDVLHAVATGVRSLDGVGTTRCYVCLD